MARWGEGKDYYTHSICRHDLYCFSIPCRRFSIHGEAADLPRYGPGPHRRNERLLVIHHTAACPAGVEFRGCGGAEAAGGPKGTVVRVMGPFLAIEAAVPAVSTPSAVMRRL
jgi:hypothetical protein